VEGVMRQKKPSQGRESTTVQMQGSLFSRTLFVFKQEALRPAFQIHEIDARPRELAKTAIQDMAFLPIRGFREERGDHREQTDPALGFLED